jgi:hypothetical protein
MRKWRTSPMHMVTTNDAGGHESDEKYPQEVVTHVLPMLSCCSNCGEEHIGKKEDGLGGLEEKKGRGLDIEVWRWISHDVGG